MLEYLIKMKEDRTDKRKRLWWCKAPRAQTNREDSWQPSAAIEALMLSWKKQWNTGITQWYTCELYAYGLIWMINMIRLTKYLWGTPQLGLALEESQISEIKWRIYASFATHPGMWSHNGGVMSVVHCISSIRKKYIQNPPPRQKFEVIDLMGQGCGLWPSWKASGWQEHFE